MATVSAAMPLPPGLFSWAGAMAVRPKSKSQERHARIRSDFIALLYRTKRNGRGQVIKNMTNGQAPKMEREREAAWLCRPLSESPDVEDGDGLFILFQPEYHRERIFEENPPSLGRDSLCPIGSASSRMSI